MGKKVIAVDLDDVVLPTAEPLLGYYNKMYGTSLKLSDYYSNDLKVHQAADRGTLIARFNEYLESDAFFELEPLQEAISALEELSNKFLIYGVTGRQSAVEEATKLWLERHFSDIFENVIFTNYYNVIGSAPLSTKAEVCREIDAIVLIEDHLDHALRVAEAGIDVLLFGDYPWNQSEGLPANVRRVSGWSEITGTLLNERS